MTYEQAFDAITYEIRKCKATAQARRLGATGRWNINSTPGGTLDQLTYEDGTTVTFNPDGTIREVRNGDFHKQILNIDSETFFKHQKDYITSKYGEEEYRFFEEYSENIDGINGDALNRILQGDSVDEVKEWIRTDYAPYTLTDNTIQYMMDNLPRYQKILEGCNLSVYGDFFTWRQTQELGEWESSDRNIARDKGMTRASVGTTNELFYSPFIPPNDIRETYDYDDNSWTVITIHEHDNDFYGAYMGNVTNYGELNYEVKSAPNQKAKRDIIDNTNHLIIQRPYHTPI